MQKALLIITIFIASGAIGQSILWDKNFGGTLTDKPRSMQPTLSGGFIIAGETESTDIDVSGNQGNDDGWLINLTITGDTLWTKAVGGSGDDFLQSVIQTSDNGFVAVGYSQSTDGDLTSNNGTFDLWVVKLDINGNLLWSKSFGGSMGDYALSVKESSNGELIILGYTQSNNGDVSGNNGGFDFWLLKLDGVGNSIWRRCYGGTSHDFGASVDLTSDGGYILSGMTESNNGDVGGNNGDSDYWVIKTDSAGTILWEQNYGGSTWDYAFSIVQTNDLGYLVAGESDSNDGDVHGAHGGVDFWALKLNSVGDTLWTKALGGSGNDVLSSTNGICETTDNGFLLAGSSDFYDGDVDTIQGAVDSWIVRLSAVGDLLWTKTLGGSGDDYSVSILEDQNNDIVVANLTNSLDGHVSNNNGNWDYWIVKLSDPSAGLLTTEVSIFSEVYPNPSSGSLTINSEKTISQIQVFDHSWRLVKEWSLGGSGHTEFDINGDDGVYFIRLIDFDNNSNVHRIIKMN